MNKRILVISNERALAWRLYNEPGREESIELIIEAYGSKACETIKEKKPDMMIIDLETPDLVKSWMSIQLDGVNILEQIPTIALSGLLNHEEREILTDMTGVPIYSKEASMPLIYQGIMRALTH